MFKKVYLSSCQDFPIWYVRHSIKRLWLVCSYIHIYVCTDEFLAFSNISGSFDSHVTSVYSCSLCTYMTATIYRQPIMVVQPSIHPSIFLQLMYVDFVQGAWLREWDLWRDVLGLCIKSFSFMLQYKIILWLSLSLQFLIIYLWKS